MKIHNNNYYRQKWRYKVRNNNYFQNSFGDDFFGFCVIPPQMLYCFTVKESKNHRVKTLKNIGTYVKINKNHNTSTHYKHEKICQNFTPPPRLDELSIEITNACPLNCVHCSSNGGETPEKKIQLEKVKDIIKSAQKLGVKRIILTGGEPFIYINLIPLCKFIKSNRLQLYIYTCGNMFSRSDEITHINYKIIQELNKLKVDKLIFNIQSSTPEIHDNITRSYSSFNNVKTSLFYSNSLKILSEIHFVPMKPNYFELGKMFESFMNHVTKISVLKFVSQGRGRINEEKLKLHENDENKLESILKSTIENYKIYRIGAPFNNQLSRNIPCTAGNNKLVIRSNGQVSPCDGLKHIHNSFDDLSLDNIFDNTLEYFWNNSPFLNFIRSFKNCEICNTCNQICDLRNECLAQKYNNCKYFFEQFHNFINSSNLKRNLEYFIESQSRNH